MDVSNHYNKVQNLSKKERECGIAYPLKKYHNFLKGDILAYYSSNNNINSLLDIGCGRGGDIHKWIKCNILNVVGIDVSPVEIEEAKRRFNEVQNSNFNYTFNVGDFRTYTIDTTFDMITAMFCINYFFDTEHKILALADKISSSLNTGGFFIGTMVDGLRLVNLLKDNDIYNDDFCEITKGWDNMPTNFGSSFTFKIKDTVVDSDDKPPIEFLSFKNALITIFQNVGMTCITITPFTPPKNEYWSTASSLYNYFVFQKL